MYNVYPNMDIDQRISTKNGLSVPETCENYLSYSSQENIDSLTFLYIESRL